MQPGTDHLLTLLQESQKYLSANNPEAMKAFQTFAQSVSRGGGLSTKFKELIAVAIAVRIRCHPCIVHHVKQALAAGATADEILESCSVAVMMGGGPAVAYTSYVVEALRDLGAID